MIKTAVIGAGLAGLACAKVLTSAGHSVTLFDKGRGPGGRLSTRRVSTSTGEAYFDHGAQYFTARDPAFIETLQGLIDENHAGQWQADLVRLTASGDRTDLSDEPLFVGTPGMNGVIKGLASGLDVHWQKRVSRLITDSDAWRLMFEDGSETAPFDRIVCAVPAEQVSDLIGSHAPSLAEKAKCIQSLPCWAGLFAFATPLSLPFDGARFTDHPIIDFIAANHTKPQRTGPPSYVVHARADWSIENLERTPEEIAFILLEELLTLADNSPELSHASAHRWRFARVDKSDTAGFAYDAKARIGCCGDWLLGPRVESAWLSGYRLGQSLSG